MASFVSSNDLYAAREEKRQARQKLLDKEKQKYLQKEEAKQKHKESGNDQWMLPGIENRLEADASILKSHKKKHKKQKKKKKRKKSSSSEDSDSAEEQWEEKPVEVKTVPEETENWMNFDDVINEENTYTSSSKKKKNEDEKVESSDPNTEIGHHPNELNPFWKDGGEGLPPEKNTRSEKTKTNKIHKEWLLKSLKRMNEQAEEEDRSIESIAAERYGSWAEFQRLLRESDPRSEKGKRREQTRTKHGKKETFMQPRDNDYDRSGRHSHHKKDEKDKFRRPRDDDSYNRQRSQKKERYNKKDTFMCPGDEEDYGRHKDRNSSSGKKSSRSHRPSWKKDKTESFKESSPRSPSIVQGNNSKILTDSKDDEKKNHNHKSQISVNDTKISEKGESQKKALAPAKLPDVAQERGTVLTEKEKNQLAAKILKAELMGNEKLANTLKSKLEKAREAEANTKKPTKSTQQSSERTFSSSESSDEETVVLTRTGKDGQSWPIEHSSMAYDSVPNKRRKKSKVPTHREGERERYFADDDRHSLQDLVRREKTEEAEDQNAMFSRLASKQFQGIDSEYFSLDDMYVSEASKKSTRTEEEARQKQKAISDHKKLARRLEKCRLCFGNPELPKHLLIAIGKKAYLSLPDHKPLSIGHCIIAPMHHCTTGVGIDEDVWDELRHFMRTLITMFKSQDMDCVFMHTCIGLKKSRHFFIDCIPMPVEEGEVAPIYFKKAIQESESEWSHNKKLIDTRGKDVRNCIPKGLPYFSVEFGMDGGFAHVVEDETLFPFYFGREIVGGMLDVEPRLWRHPPKDHFTEQTKRSLQFSEWWKPHDWTVNISSTS